MDVNGWMVWVVLALGVASAGLLVWLVVMALRAQSGGVAAQGLLKELQDLRAQMQQGSERLSTRDLMVTTWVKSFDTSCVFKHISIF